MDNGLQKLRQRMYRCCRILPKRPFEIGSLLVANRIETAGHFHGLKCLKFSQAADDIGYLRSLELQWQL